MALEEPIGIKGKPFKDYENVDHTRGGKNRNHKSKVRKIFKLKHKRWFSYRQGEVRKEGKVVGGRE